MTGMSCWVRKKMEGSRETLTGARGVRVREQKQSVTDDKG